MIAKQKYLWTQGQIVSIAFLDGEYKYQYLVQKWALEVLKQANLRFLWLFYSPGQKFMPSAQVRIRLNDRNHIEHSVHCAVGTECLMYPQDSSTMVLNRVGQDFNEIERLEGILQGADNPLEYTRDYIQNSLIPHYTNMAKATVQHEFMHMLGITHEQLHPQSPNVWENPELFGAFEPWITEYDSSSITHYPYDQYKGYLAEATRKDLKPSNPMNQYRMELSKGDLAGIRKLYGVRDAAKESTPAIWENSITAQEQYVEKMV